MRTTLLLFAIVQGLMGGCSSATQRPESVAASAISLNKMESLKLGVATSEDVTTRLGQPSQVVPQEDKSVSWIYRDSKDGLERAILSFSENGTLIDKYLAITTADPERDVAVLMKRLEPANLKKETTTEDFGHYFRTMTSLVDKSQGIAVALTSDGANVSSINWYNTKVRTVAKSISQENTVFLDSATGLVTKAPGAY